MNGLRPDLWAVQTVAPVSKRAVSPTSEPAVPSGTCWPSPISPNVETLGYCLRSLRDRDDAALGQEVLGALGLETCNAAALETGATVTLARALCGWRLALLLLLCLPCAARAQWQTQSILIKPGWSAIYLHVDASYQTLDQLVGSDPDNPISQLWLWQPPAGTEQFISSPQAPIGGTQWAVWGRLGSGVSGTLGALVPEAAYLVYSGATTNYTWSVEGKPVAPEYSWTTSGENFVGFPTPPSGPPTFEAFLSLAPDLAGAAQIYQYQGGALGASNPSQLFAYHTTPVSRGAAFWINSGTYFNKYFGPFQVAFTDRTGAKFGDTAGQYSFRLVNVTGTNVTVTLDLLPSETPPTGQVPIVDVPPLLVRGTQSLSNLTYAYSVLSTNSPQTWTLTPQGQDGSDIEVILGLNRYIMTNSRPGALYAGILQFTDGFGLSEVDVPVTALAASTAGLWVGDASVTQVGSYLKTYQTNFDGSMVVSSNGNYVVSSVNTNLGPVTQPFPLRLILHNDGTTTYLLQRVYYGLDAGSNVVVATSQSAMDPVHLDTARRISAIDLPWSSNNVPWACTGTLGPGGTLSTTVGLAYDDQASNPFLHTYHPDHDNLDASYQNELPRGAESYDITRQITLDIMPPGNDFNSLTHAGQSLSGTYLEAITLTGAGSASRTFHVSGIFAINRISTIATLTQP